MKSEFSQDVPSDCNGYVRDIGEHQQLDDTFEGLVIVVSKPKEIYMSETDWDTGLYFAL